MLKSTALLLFIIFATCNSTQENAWFNKDNLNFYKADEKCFDLHYSSLITVTNNSVIDRLKREMLNHKVDKAWVGLKRMSSQLKWISGYKKIPYHVTDYNLESHYCAYMDSRGELYMHNCESLLPSFCESQPPPDDGQTDDINSRPNSLQLDDITSASLSCPSGYKLFDRSCLKVVSDSLLNWTSAQARCTKEDGNLLIIQSLDKQYAMSLLAGQLDKNIDKVWIGLAKNETSYHFAWVNGEAMKVYNIGDYRKLENPTEKICVSMHFSLNSKDFGQWNEESCQEKMAYVCQVGAKSGQSTAPVHLLSRGVCADGFLAYQNACYSVSFGSDNKHQGFKRSKSSLNDSLSSFCQVAVNNATVVTFSNKAEVAFLRLIVRYYSSKTMQFNYTWLGWKFDKKFQLQSESPQKPLVDFTDIETAIESVRPLLGRPNYSCLALSLHEIANIQWTGVECEDESFPVVCKYDTRSAQASTTDRPDSSQPLYCPSNWQLHASRRKCYSPISQGKSEFLDAHATCEKNPKSSMTSLHSLQDTKFLANLTQGKPIWIGLSISIGKSPSKFILSWLDHSPVDYHQFAISELIPESIREHQQFAAYLNPRDETWHMSELSDERHFMCQMAAQTEPLIDHKEFCLSGTAYCVKIASLEEDFYSASKSCPSGYQPAIINSLAQQNFITETLRSANLHEKSVWFGLDSETGSWLGDPRRAVLFQNWFLEQDFTDNQGMCPSLFKGQWHQAQCEKQFPVVCSKSTPVAEPPTQPLTNPRATCPSDEYTLVAGISCFTLLPGQLTWSEAEKACAVNNGQLALVSDFHDQSLLHAFLSDRLSADQSVWTGMTFNQHSELSTGAKYTHWKNFSHILQNSCVAMDSTEGGWLMASCNERHPAVCQAAVSQRLDKTTQQKLLPKVGVCAKGFWQFQDVCLKLVKVDQLRANLDCPALHFSAECSGRVSPRTEAETSYMRSMLLLIREEDAWLSVVYLPQESLHLFSHLQPYPLAGQLQRWLEMPSLDKVSDEHSLESVDINSVLESQHETSLWALNERLLLSRATPMLEVANQGKYSPVKFEFIGYFHQSLVADTVLPREDFQIFSPLESKTLCDIEGAVFAEGLCFQAVLDSSETWLEAKASCLDRNATLASTTQSADFWPALFAQLFQENIHSGVWIGLHRFHESLSFADGSMTLSNGYSYLDFKNLVDSSNTCVYASSNGSLNWGQCSRRWPKICSWEPHVSQKLPLLEAKQFCQSRGGHLPTRLDMDLHLHSPLTIWIDAVVLDQQNACFVQSSGGVSQAASCDQPQAFICLRNRDTSVEKRCREGFVHSYELNGDCFRAVADHWPGSQAAARCHGLDAELVNLSPNSHKLHFFTSLLASQNLDRAWTQDCRVLSRQGEVIVQNCESEAPGVICQARGRAQGVCPANFEEFFSGERNGDKLCYHFANQFILGMDEVRGYCRNISPLAHPLTIKNREEASFLSALLHRKSLLNRVWLGLRVESLPSAWTWYDGRPVNYTKLRPKDVLDNATIGDYILQMPSMDFRPIKLRSQAKAVSAVCMVRMPSKASDELVQRSSLTSKACNRWDLLRKPKNVIVASQLGLYENACYYVPDRGYGCYVGQDEQWQECGSTAMQRKTDTDSYSPAIKFFRIIGILGMVGLLVIVVVFFTRNHSRCTRGRVLPVSFINSATGADHQAGMHPVASFIPYGRLNNEIEIPSDFENCDGMANATVHFFDPLTDKQDLHFHAGRRASKLSPISFSDSADHHFE